MLEKFYAVPESTHNTLVEAAYLKRGYTRDEVIHAVRVAANLSILPLVNIASLVYEEYATISSCSNFKMRNLCSFDLFI